MDNMRVNASGYKDITAYKAMSKVSKGEKTSEERFNKLLKKIFRECDKAGYHLESRLVLRDMETGKVRR